MKIAASSAYKLILKESHMLDSLESRPFCWALAMSLWSGSMARRNSMGDRGSPYLTPL
jgi:hypothetical protein